MCYRRFRFHKMNTKTTTSTQVVYLVLSCPTSLYLFKVNNENIRAINEICSKLTIKSPERRQWRRFRALIVNFERNLQFT